MFASQTTDTVPLVMPDGTVNVVTVQKLNWKRLREAGENRSMEAMEKAAKAGPEVLELWERADQKREEREKERQKSGGVAVAESKTIAQQKQERYDAYDKETVLRYGVLRWTSTIKDLEEGLADLDEDSSEKLHRKILDLSLPPLTEQEVEAKKGEG